MAPRISALLSLGWVCAHAAAISNSTTKSAERRRIEVRISKTRLLLSGGGCPQFAAPCVGKLALQLGCRRVAVVHVERPALSRHDHCGGQRVDLEAIGELTFGDRVDLVDTHAGELRQGRLLVGPAYRAVFACEVQDVRLDV